MSFRNTKTPCMSDITGKARYQVPRRKAGAKAAYYLTPDLEAQFRRLYPITMNRDMMRIFGISFSTMQRFKRQLGLEKKMKTIRHKQAQLAKRICEKNGYYDSMRGHRPSDACMEAARKKRENGFNPWLQLRDTNRRKYNRCMKQKSEQRKDLWRKERNRVDWGLEQRTNLHVPFYPYGIRRTNFRNCCKLAGYIPGNARVESERWVIYYTEETKRGTIREKYGEALGFRFVQRVNQNQTTTQIQIDNEENGRTIGGGEGKTA